MTVEEMQGINRNKLVFSKLPLVLFSGSLTRFQATTTYIIHPMPFQEEEEKKKKKNHNKRPTLFYRRVFATPIR